jgi:hypothetical protein
MMEAGKSDQGIVLFVILTCTGLPVNAIGMEAMNILAVLV